MTLTAVAGFAIGQGMARPASAAQSRPAVDRSGSTFHPQAETLAQSSNSAKTPETVSDLLELEAAIRQVVDEVLPATVGLIVGQGQGSGVIVSPDGYVLTAAHVSGQPGQRVQVILSDGRRLDAVSLGLNRSLDNGLIRITEPNIGPLPYARIGQAVGLPLGTWTVALGHPGGYQQDRPPVVRVGRLLANRDDLLLTDNTLVGGDSGGPLFDLDGRVIGIHSRIGSAIRSNIHVPVERYIEDWDRLADAEDFGSLMPDWLREGMNPADDGLRFDLEEGGSNGALVDAVVPGSPAEDAGIRPGDRITAFDGQEIENGQDMMIRRMSLRPGRPVVYTVQRGDEMQRIRLRPVQPRNDPFERERSSTAVMGVYLDQMYADMGARIEQVAPDGPADRAGLTGGDVLLSIDGRFLPSAAEIGDALRNHEPGDVVKVTFRRDGTEQTVDVTLARHDEIFRQPQLP